MISSYFFEILSRCVADRPSIFENFPVCIFKKIFNFENSNYFLDPYNVIFTKSHEPVNDIILFCRNTFSLFADRPSTFENVPAAKSINMLPICENKSFVGF